MPNPEETIDKVKAWLLPGVLALLNIVLTTQINNAANEIKETRNDIIELTSTVKVQSAQMEFLSTRVSGLESAKSDAAAIHAKIEERLNSLEQRAAIHDEFMRTHK